LDDWVFTVDEVSVNVYRVVGQDACGRRVERTGTDPDALLVQCKEDAVDIDRRAT
jgi:hypothetical protein